MDITKEQQGNPKRIKKNRVSKHEVPITESNKYKHWEIKKHSWYVCSLFSS